MSKDPHFSPSQLRLWKRCQRSWYYRYVRNIKTPTGARAAAGKCIHRTVQAHYTSMKATGAAWTPDEAAQFARADWDEAAYTVNWESEKKKRSYFTDAVPMAAAAHARLVATMGEPPEYVEQRFEIGVPGLDHVLVVVPDAIQPDGEVLIVRDLKTLWTPQSRIRPSDHEQVALYCYAAAVRVGSEFPVITGIIDSVRPTLVTEIPVDGSGKMVARIFADLRAMERGIAARSWVRNTDSWACSDAWCGYWHVCREDGDG